MPRPVSRVPRLADDMFDAADELAVDINVAISTLRSAPSETDLPSPAISARPTQGGRSCLGRPRRLHTEKRRSSARSVSATPRHQLVPSTSLHWMS